MNRRIRYFLGAAASLPLLPLIAYQGRTIRESVPVLPEAKGTTGLTDVESEKEVNVIFIGESTIAGVGIAKHSNGIPGAIADKLASSLQKNIRWKVYARKGYTAEMVSSKLVDQIVEENIDLIVVGLGGNDTFQLNSPWKWGKNMRKLIKKLQSKHVNTPIAFLNMPPVKEFPAFTPIIKFTLGNLAELHGEELKVVTKDFDQVYYNPEIITLKHWIGKLGNIYKRADFFSDGVHPSQLTYQEWGKDFAEFLIRENVLQN